MVESVATNEIMGKGREREGQGGGGARKGRRSEGEGGKGEGGGSMAAQGVGEAFEYVASAPVPLMAARVWHISWCFARPPGEQQRFYFLFFCFFALP